ncbi:MAG: metalloregulator ArsR/SmtB family transcription factor [Clostridiales Family XIII bacterium]|jgi:DNA-binding transcriptional ArsR family regulator|nr:metalloregulator ArsR/SmtB family transcription factor [Clostridiales Family XIII bacterium]
MMGLLKKQPRRRAKGRRKNRNASREKGSVRKGLMSVSAKQSKQNTERAGLSLDEFVRLAELYKNFSDPTRLKILYELSHGDLYVQEIAARLGMSPSAISHQLRILRNVRLVRFEKEGKGVRYALDDDHVEDILRIGVAHVNHSE